MLLKLLQYWFTVERDKLLAANLCKENKNSRDCLLHRENYRYKKYTRLENNMVATHEQK